MCIGAFACPLASEAALTDGLIDQLPFRGAGDSNGSPLTTAPVPPADGPDIQVQKRPIDRYNESIARAHVEFEIQRQVSNDDPGMYLRGRAAAVFVQQKLIYNGRAPTIDEQNDFVRHLDETMKSVPPSDSHDFAAISKVLVAGGVLLSGGELAPFVPALAEAGTEGLEALDHHVIEPMNSRNEKDELFLGKLDAQAGAGRLAGVIVDLSSGSNGGQMGLFFEHAMGGANPHDPAPKQFADPDFQTYMGVKDNAKLLQAIQNAIQKNQPVPPEVLAGVLRGAQASLSTEMKGLLQKQEDDRRTEEAKAKQEAEDAENRRLREIGLTATFQLIGGLMNNKAGRVVSTVGSTAVSTAFAADNLMHALNSTKSAFDKGLAIASMGFNIFQGVSGIMSLFGGAENPNAQEFSQIKDMISSLSNQMQEMQKQLNERLDKMDHKLDFLVEQSIEQLKVLNGLVQQAKTWHDIDMGGISSIQERLGRLRDEMNHQFAAVLDTVVSVGCRNAVGQWLAGTKGCRDGQSGEHGYRDCVDSIGNLGIDSLRSQCSDPSTASNAKEAEMLRRDPDQTLDFFIQYAQENLGVSIPGYSNGVKVGNPTAIQAILDQTRSMVSNHGDFANSSPTRALLDREQNMVDSTASVLGALKKSGALWDNLFDNYNKSLRKALDAYHEAAEKCVNDEVPDFDTGFKGFNPFGPIDQAVKADPKFHVDVKEDDKAATALDSKNDGGRLYEIGPSGLGYIPEFVTTKQNMVRLGITKPLLDGPCEILRRNPGNGQSGAGEPYRCIPQGEARDKILLARKRLIDCVQKVGVSDKIDLDGTLADLGTARALIKRYIEYAMPETAQTNGDIIRLLTNDAGLAGDELITDLKEYRFDSVKCLLFACRPLDPANPEYRSGQGGDLVAKVAADGKPETPRLLRAFGSQIEAIRVRAAAAGMAEIDYDSEKPLQFHSRVYATGDDRQGKQFTFYVNNEGPVALTCTAHFLFRSEQDQRTFVVDDLTVGVTAATLPGSANSSAGSYWVKSKTPIDYSQVRLVTDKGTYNIDCVPLARRRDATPISDRQLDDSTREALKNARVGAIPIQKAIGSGRQRGIEGRSGD